MFCINCDRSQIFLDYFTELYGEKPARQCLDRLHMLLESCNLDAATDPRRETPTLWSERDVFLITYGDMVKHGQQSPLARLRAFLAKHVGEAIETVHILPFFPYSSDDGFSVIDYRKVDPVLGDWKDVEALAEDYKLMFDLVLNHCSRESAWFRDYVNGVAPGRDFFITVDNPEVDLSRVVRPRNLPLLTRTHTRDGESFVWTTFSADQIDLNFANPDVLFEFLDILLFYVARGARFIRLDAIAFLWKRIGTNCLHLPETHTVVKLMRAVLDSVAPEGVLLTETNVPHDENIAYFGDGDEARMVYQFSLPPLILHAIANATSEHLTAWAKTVCAAPEGCTYLNFTASHDGIGVRPLEGLIGDEELNDLCTKIRARGGFVSTKKNPDGSQSPYELNITYYDALSDIHDDETVKFRRFFCSQAIALTLRGIPAVYFNSLIGAGNDRSAAERQGKPRAINRKKWKQNWLNTQLNRPESHAAQVLAEYKRLLATRRRHPAFHPDGAQSIPDLGRGVFAIQRTAPDGGETVVGLFNLTDQSQAVDLAAIDLPHPPLVDLVAENEVTPGDGPFQLAPYQYAWLHTTS